MPEFLDNISIQLFFEFFKTGLFAVGGGLATLPFLAEMSRVTGWFSAADIANMIAISESTPGPLGINMATYAGYQTLGLWGGFIATCGIVCPALFVIVLVSEALSAFKNSVIVSRIFSGLRPASCALVAAAGLGVAKIALLRPDDFAATGNFLSLVDWKSLLLALVIFWAYKKYKKHPILYIVFSAAVGIACGL